jgi:O-antigen/teichoic acid export membrane protein
MAARHRRGRRDDGTIGLLPPKEGGLGEIASTGAAVAIAGAIVNVLGFIVPGLAARNLPAADLGALGAVLGLGGIASVAGLGLQTAVAVRWARQGAIPQLRRMTAFTAAATGAVFVLATPIAAATLHLAAAEPLLMAATIVATVFGSRYLGELQGSQRFSTLAAGMVVLAVARYGGIIIGLLAGAGIITSLVLGAAVAWLTVPILAALTGRVSHVDGGEPLRARDIMAAGGATLATLAISYADVILARGLLPDLQSAAYSVGSLLTKGALWAPQVVTVLALPRLAQRRQGTLQMSVGLVAACGAALVLGSMVLGTLAMTVAGGKDYTYLGPYAGRFAAVGALYAVVFVLVNAEIAAGVRRPAAPLWIALVVLGLAARFVFPHTLNGVLTASLVTAALTTVVMGWRARSLHRAAHAIPATTKP